MKMKTVDFLRFISARLSQASDWCTNGASGFCGDGEKYDPRGDLIEMSGFFYALQQMVDFFIETEYGSKETNDGLEASAGKVSKTGL